MQHGLKLDPRRLEVPFSRLGEDDNVDAIHPHKASIGWPLNPAS
jgi:hypothetical protein